MRSFSIPDVRALVDTSPPVFYPPTRRDRSSSHTQPANPNDSPARPKIHPSASLGNFLPVNVSANDVSGEWKLVHRQASISEEKKTPTRPSHRRSQFALPPGLSQSQVAPGHSQLGRRPGPSPMGKLQEFSRNPLASASAISLPTLAEMEFDGLTPSPSIPPSPMVRPRTRRCSRISMISPVEAPSPVTASSSVPPPQNLSVHASMPPPARLRPPPSPRSWSTQEFPATRPKSLYTHSRRPSLGSTSSVSDVAVLATWSFPSSPEKGQEGQLPIVQPTSRLRDRLRSLSTLASSDLSTSPSTLSIPQIEEPSPRPKVIPPHLTHQHSHSSPTPLQPLLPPPRGQRRPTGGLRQPNPLAMPYSPSTLSSSPGSMLSDESSSICPSPTNSLESLPPVPTPPSLGAGEETKVWLGRRGRSASVSLGRKD